MTSLEAVFAVLEGPRFATEVNVASNLKTFLRALASHPAVQELATAMSVHAVCEQVCERAGELAMREVPADYEHPGDSAMAAYLWLLIPEPADAVSSLGGRGSRRAFC